VTKQRETMKATYTWNTDAASGTVTADDIDAALEQLVVQGEWAEPESAREQRDIANGAFLIIRGPQESLVIRSPKGSGER